MTRVLLCVVLAGSLVGCSKSLAPIETLEGITAREVVERGTFLGTNPEGDWYEVNGVRIILGEPEVIEILDYPCDFIGPLPKGHGRDCGVPEDWAAPAVPSPPSSGDPTADD